MKPKFRRLLPALFLLCLAQLHAQTPGRYQFEIGLGLHSFYLPGIGARWANPQPVVTLGAYRSINSSGNLRAGLSLGYQRHRYQGDGLYIQAQFRYNPLIGRHFEPGIAAGAGYQMAFYPSASLRWDGDKWVKGRAFKGVVQAPLRISLGYRSGHYTPFIACQTNILFGYSPDLSPLPVTALLAGVKISPR
ncbi:MAG: hypothetical protein U0U46_08485 [Saprospiraceae bacterium]